MKMISVRTGCWESYQQWLFSPKDNLRSFRDIHTLLLPWLVPMKLFLELHCNWIR